MGVTPTALLIQNSIRQILVRYRAAHISVQLGKCKAAVFLSSVFVTQLLGIVGERHNAKGTAGGVVVANGRQKRDIIYADRRSVFCAADGEIEAEQSADGILGIVHSCHKVAERIGDERCPAVGARQCLDALQYVRTVAYNDIGAAFGEYCGE